MIHTLENRWLQLEVRTVPSRWSVIPLQHGGPLLKDLRVGLRYRRGRVHHHLLDRWPAVTVTGPETVTSPHGQLRQLALVMEGDHLRCSLTFALPTELPMLFWKLEVDNVGHSPVFVDRLDLLSAGFIYRSRYDQPGEIAFSNIPERVTSRDQSPRAISSPELAFFSNGLQSWSYSGVYTAEDRFRHTRLSFLRSPVERDAGTPAPSRRGLFASHMFGVLGDQRSRSAILAGFLSQREQFGALEAFIGMPRPALRLWANGDGARLGPGASMKTDWACLTITHLDGADPLGPYFETVARENSLPDEPPSWQKPPAGWCSWYQFSSEDYRAALTANNIRHNLAALTGLRHELPLDVIQIDDGFEAQVGDWFEFSPGFPEGVAPLAAEIRQAGFTPGLWLAPFMVHPGARLASERPGWLLRGRLGRPANAGFLWGAFCAALDLTHPEALEHAAEAVHTAVHRWGFPYLKLDFLYAAALPGQRHDPTRTRAQVLRAGLEAVRQAAGDQAFLLGCGCPLGPAIGLLDAMRIGADVARRWNPSFKGRELFFRNEPDLPSARNASHNALTRASLHRRWWVNDPDCLLLRPETHLTLAEVRSLATIIALTGGSVFLSDHLPALPPDRLRLAECLLPPIGRRPHVLDWFDHPTPQRLQLDLDGPAGAWHLIALFNWRDRPGDLVLNPRDLYLDPQVVYYAREYWSGKIYRFGGKEITGSELTIPDVPAHGVQLFALRPRHPYQPQYLGSDLHISQGLEVAEWEYSELELRLKLQRPGKAHGKVVVTLPRQPEEVLQDGRVLTWESVNEGAYIVSVNFDKIANIKIRYQS